MDSTQKKQTAQSVYEDVRALLGNMMQDITEPVRVREEDLASQLGVSRTPVREALIRLESTGLISLRPGRGALLSPVTDAEYIEWLQLREMLEGFAAHEAALNASQRDVERLRALFEPFLAVAPGERDADAYAQANVTFHAEIIALANNRLLEKVWAAFGHRQTTFRRQTIKRLHRGEDSLREHLAMIEAIARRDAALAERLARDHVHSLLVAFRRFTQGGDSASDA
ncbi:GntR family transcriptional regulator [Castellaniella denitrificans]|uniref:GntR family transcriptional regulator n=1 Tax=Castellaniella denitrificans TaxID=56119 RepID=A0ABT4M2J3_9BURK|nr:GntR family transcriptional regulator [Castellaniella denitrificans]MCZ4329543.1 GntR family transcriptional regulator [Castellaniella denitrificans]